jgi:hypothetical protein
VREIVAAGDRRAREVARATMAEVRDAMGLAPDARWEAR